VFYGLSIYYFLPYSLLSFNFGLLLTIFFLILIGILLGLTLISLNLQRILEYFFTYIILFFEKWSMKQLILKNLVAHRDWNKMTVLIFALSIGFIILCIVAYNLELWNLKLMTMVSLGSSLRVTASNTYYMTPNRYEPVL